MNLQTMEVRIVLLMWYHARLQSFYANRSVAFRPLLRHVPQQQVKKNERSKKIWENYYKAAQKKTLRDVFVFFLQLANCAIFFLLSQRGAYRSTATMQEDLAVFSI